MYATGRRLVTLAICTPIVSALSVACSGGPAPVAADCIKVVSESGERTDECLPLAPESDRIDLATPKFSHPTPITNPLHPTSRVEQVIFGGHVDNKPFRTEVTLLPETRPTTGPCGTSVRTIPVSKTARSPTPKEPGWSMTRRRRR